MGPHIVCPVLKLQCYGCKTGKHGGRGLQDIEVQPDAIENGELYYWLRRAQQWIIAYGFAKRNNTERMGKTHGDPLTLQLFMPSVYRRKEEQPSAQAIANMQSTTTSHRRRLLPEGFHFEHKHRRTCGLCLAL